MRWQIFLFLACLFGSASPVLAHGVAIEHRQTRAIEIRAAYDNGDPMAEGQVTVYAPEKPSQAWLKGTTAEDGTFAFVPDPELNGEWEVKVRKSGHGDLVRIPVEEPEENSSQQAQVNNDWQGGNYTPLQKILMGGLGVWGFIGTALFFARNRSHQN
ncbi:MAG: carboxypeptidase regulatory-like domain-containing protein [Halothece sp.]